MNKALYPRDNLDRLYMTRKGGRDIASIEHSIDISIRELEECITWNQERLITTTRNNANNIMINRITKKKEWEEKQRYWYCKKINKQNLARKDLDVAKKGKTYERNQKDTTKQNSRYGKNRRND